MQHQDRTDQVTKNPQARTPEELDAIAQETFSALPRSVVQLSQSDRLNNLATRYLVGDLETSAWKALVKRRGLTLLFPLIVAILVTKVAVTAHLRDSTPCNFEVIAAGEACHSYSPPMLGLLYTLAFGAIILLVVRTFNAVMDARREAAEARQGQAIVRAVAEVDTPLGRATKRAMYQGSPQERLLVGDALKSMQERAKRRLETRYYNEEDDYLFREVEKHGARRED